MYIHLFYLCFMKKDSQFLIRVSESELEGFKRAAEIAGIGLSAWARQKLRGAAIQELQNAGQQIPFLQPINLNKNG